MYSAEESENSKDLLKVIKWWWMSIVIPGIFLALDISNIHILATHFSLLVGSEAQQSKQDCVSRTVWSTPTTHSSLPPPRSRYAPCHRVCRHNSLSAALSMRFRMRVGRPCLDYVLKSYSYSMYHFLQYGSTNPKYRIARIFFFLKTKWNLPQN